jgi:hypothetical protein
MKTTATYETITPNRAKEMLENSDLKYWPIDYEKVKIAVSEIERMTDGSQKRENSNLFMIMDDAFRGIPNTGENVLTAIIETNKPTSVAFIQNLPSTKMVILNPDKKGLEKFEFWARAISTLKEAAINECMKLLNDEKSIMMYSHLGGCFSTPFHALSWGLWCHAKKVYEQKRNLEEFAYSIPLHTFLMCYRFATCLNKNVQNSLELWMDGKTPGVALFDELFNESSRLWREREGISKQEKASLTKSRKKALMDFFLKMDVTGGIFSLAEQDDLSSKSILEQEIAKAATACVSMPLVCQI